VSLVTSRVAIAVAGGVAVGFVVGVFSSHALARFLYDVAPTDPTTFAMAGLAMIVAALSACAVPVRRALKIDPVRAIRTE
jgi:putative ABC transport system permease protein